MAFSLRVAAKTLALVALFGVAVLIYRDSNDNTIRVDRELQILKKSQYEEIAVPSYKVVQPLPPPYTDNITFVLNNNVCSSKENITAIIIVHSHAGRLDQRALMRATFSSASLAAINLRRVFVLASLKDGVELDKMKRYPNVTNAQILEESELYGDTVQLSFIEGYYKIIYKNIMSLRWATEYCPQARFVAKMDDDNLVNFYKVAEVMNKIPVAEEDFLVGAEWTGTKPRRTPNSSYYISYEEYAPEVLPNYLSGIFYWTSMASTRKLLAAARKVPFFKADDVFLTGMVADKAGVRRKDVKHMIAGEDELGCCKNLTSGEVFECKYMARMQQRRGNTLLRKFSEHVEYCRRAKCSPPVESGQGLHCF